MLKEKIYNIEISKVRSKLDKIKENGFFIGKNKVRIYYEKYTSDKEKAVIISHGFCENLEKYTELINWFYELGYSVYALEHRGMARSSHMGKDNSQVNIDSFDNYIYDMHMFIEDIVKKDNRRYELYLYAHSLGGLIATRYIQEYPHTFKKVILSSPFFKANVKFPLCMVKLVTKLYVLCGKGDCYTMIHKKYDKYIEFEKAHTSSKSRYEFQKKIVEENEAYQMLGGSYNWLDECMINQKKVFDRRNIDRITEDILLVSCGQDRLVELSEHKRFADRVSSCYLYIIENSKHEPYCERDEILEEYLKRLIEFIEE